MRTKVFFFFICFPLLLSAQEVKSVFGRVVDNDSIPIEGVAVIMQKVDSTFISGTITNQEGAFVIKSSIKPYRLIFQHISYALSSLKSSKENVGTVVLKESSNQLGELVIKAERPIIKMVDNQLTYDVAGIQSKKITSNAFELLKELPAITSLDGNSLNLAGTSGVTVMLSGKVSHLNNAQLMDYLKTLPSEEVDKVEILYNAPPQWHVKGAVINVVLKRKKSRSLNGQIQANWINQHQNSFDVASSVFLTSPKWSFDLMYKFADDKNLSRNQSRGIHSLTDGVHKLETDTKDKIHDNKHSLYTDIGYHINDKNSLELTYNGLFSPKMRTDSYSKNSLFSDANSLNDGNDYLHNIALSYTLQQEVTAGIEYTGYLNRNTQRMKYLTDESYLDAFSYRTKQKINKMRAYVDLSKAFKHNWTVSYGGNYNYVKNTNKQKNEDIQHDGTNSYTQNSQTKEYTSNVYLGAQKSFWGGKMSVDLSLIGEFYKINDYKKNSLLPNLTVTYVPTNSHIFQLTYNSLRTYPSYWERQDYTSYSDAYTVHMGNPLLRPARTSTASMTYILKNKYMFQVSYYYVKDFFIEQSYQSPEMLQLLYRTFNIDYTSNLNFMVVIPVNVSKWLNSNLIANIYNERYKSKDWFGLNYNRNRWTKSIMANNTFTISQKPKITLNLMAFYRTPTIQGIWDLKRNWGVNAGLRYSFAKDRAILGLQCNDMFESFYPKIKVRFDNQYQNISENFYNRCLTLSFTYKFKGYKDKQVKQIDTSRFGIN